MYGNVKILLKDRFEEGCENRIVLTRPNTPHFISCNPDTLYSRLYLVFTDEFIAGSPSEWAQLSRVFGENGTILTLSGEEVARIRQLIEQIEREGTSLGQRLLIYYLLLQLLNCSPQSLKSANTPPYVFQALTYLERHYVEKINFSKLAEQLYVGRTTLMTAFREYTGSSLNSYIVRYRLKQAQRFLREGKSVQATAELCGFGDSSSLIRDFKQIYGTTPGKFLKSDF